MWVKNCEEWNVLVMPVLLAVNIFMAWLAYHIPASDSAIYWSFVWVVWPLWAWGGVLYWQAFVARRLTFDMLLFVVLGGITAVLNLEGLAFLFGRQLTDYPLVAHSFAITALVFAVPMGGALFFRLFAVKGNVPRRKAVVVGYTVAVVGINVLALSLLQTVR